LSKLSTLKQDAYKAGKKKNWAQAILLYEQILEQDKNNPTVINELGDLCLKGDESRRAVSYFLSAAAKYRTTGLLNNAVAIYKKILRHESDNLNAHWYLAETRASQGLIVEGENHGVQFLDSSENVSGDIKEIFLKRCQELFGLFPESRVILSRLAQIFRMWSMELEAARADCLAACLDYAGGKETEARQSIDDLTAKVPEVMNYSEFTKWNVLLNPESAAPAVDSSFGNVSFGEDETSAAPVAEIDFSSLENPAPAHNSGSFDDLNLNDTPTAGTSAPKDALVPPAPDESPLLSKPVPAPAPAPVVVDDSDDDGCFDIGGDTGGVNFDDLIDQAAEGLHSDEPASEVLAAPADKDIDAGDSVDLLSQMLAKESDDTDQASGELATITSEIGSIVGGEGEGDDAERLYEMGMVYLEMGMFDQACESFETAAADEKYSVRAHETWGVTLQRANRHDEAIEVLTNGLEFAEKGSREYQGLMYHLGMAMEKSDKTDEAIECFRKINDVNPKYLDVGRRLAKLTAV
jgi:tetratricopeptide (TPR) repeat protein